MSVLTPLLAIYGAALSTYICIRNILSERVKVFVTHGWDYKMIDGTLDDTPTALELSAVNKCQKDVVVSHLSLEITDLGYIAPGFLEYDKPMTVFDNIAAAIRRSGATKGKITNEILKPGHELKISFNYQQLVEALRDRGIVMPLRVRAVFEDTLENVFFSSWFRIGKH